MKRTVFILATCRKPELLPASTLIFDSIRTGFPTSEIDVAVNPWYCTDEIQAAATKVGARAIKMPAYNVLHEWILWLIGTNRHPFIIADTDLIFWDRIEDWRFSEPLAGRFIPEFDCPFIGRRTHERLHTALMFIDPQEIRRRVEKLDALEPNHPFGTTMELTRTFRHSLRERGRSLLTGGESQRVRHWFHDTCSLLYHAIGGQAFTEKQLDCYDHLNCGTYSDIAESRIPGLSEKHRAVFANHELLRGAWRHQERWYAERSHGEPSPIPTA